MRAIPNIESYDLFSLIIEKTSHILRTPLGVSKSIAKDAADGEVLEQVDFQDAYNANEQILHCLNFLKTVAPQITTSQIASSKIGEELSELFDLQTLIPKTFKARCQCESGGESRIELKISATRASQVVLCLFLYFDELLSKENTFRLFYDHSTESIGIELLSKQSLGIHFSEDFFEQMYNDGRLASVSFLVAMLLSNSISYELLEDKKCVFLISL